VFWRRGLVRAVFAYFEGLISSLKLKSIVMHKVRQYELAKESHTIRTPVSFESVFADLYSHLEKARVRSWVTPQQQSPASLLEWPPAILFRVMYFEGFR